jgi:type II secretory pathway pseudopilin PulG
MNRRQGFTITELMVSLALIIFIMLILTEAFSEGLETFRRLKAVGDMQERTRSAIIALRRDLVSDHFDDGSSKTRLSDQAANKGGPNPDNWKPPLKGYFRIWQIPPPAAVAGSAGEGTHNSILEGIESSDGVNIQSYRSTSHVLQFTCRRPQISPGRDNLRTVGVPPSGAANIPMTTNPPPPNVLELQGPHAFRTRGLMNTPWYEVTYFLAPSYLRDDNGAVVRDGANNPIPILTTADPGGTPTQLYTLYRRERAVSDHAAKTPLQMVPVAGYEDVSTSYQTAGTAVVNQPDDVTDPRTRFGMDHTGTSFAGRPLNFPNWTLADGLGAGDPRRGDDVLLGNVISFDVKVLQQGWNPPPPTGTGAGANGAFQSSYFHPVFVDLPPAALGHNSYFQTQGWSVFDTWCRVGSPQYDAVTPPPAGGPVGYPYAIPDPPNSTYPGWYSEGQEFSLPLPIRIHAIQITIRVWDQKTEQSRQVSIIQDM